MINQALKQIGLTDGEIKVYLALLELGSCTTWNIFKKSKVSGSKTYEVLERLASKGLVSSITKNGVKYFEASSPERIIDYLDDKQKGIETEKAEIHKIIPELILKQKSAQSSIVKVFTGWEGIKTANEDIIGSLHKGDEWLSLGIGITEFPKHLVDYFNKRQQIRIKKGAVEKLLIHRKWTYLIETRKNWKHTQIRFIDEKIEMPTSTDIYKNKVIIFIYAQESPMAILIENKHVYENFKRYFYAMWDKADKS
jgi:HTH-type transcriptional regulator, sugar sensing transcriptional regulator